MIGSSAFVLGMRSHRGHPTASAMIRASSAPISPEASAASAVALDSEDDFEFDFIEAATRAAVERENRLVQQHGEEAPTKKNVAKEWEPTVSWMPLMATETVTPPNEDDYELDFIEAATMAAVEREQREAREKAEIEAASSFAVYPAVVDPLPGARSQPLVRSE